MTCVAIDLLNIQVTLRASAVVFVLLCHVWLCLLPLLQWPPQDNFPGAELYIEAKVVLLTYFPKWRHPPATPPTGHDFAKSSICDFTTQRSIWSPKHPVLGQEGKGLSLCLSFPGLCRELQAPLPLASPGVPAQAWLLVYGSPLSPTLRLAGEGSLLAPPLAGLPIVLGYPQGAQLPPNPEVPPA